MDGIGRFRIADPRISAAAASHELFFVFVTFKGGAAKSCKPLMFEAARGDSAGFDTRNDSHSQLFGQNLTVTLHRKLAAERSKQKIRAY